MGIYKALEISPIMPLVSVEVVVAVVDAAATAVAVVSRRCGSAANADAARARIMLVNFIVRKVVRKMDVVQYSTEGEQRNSQMKQQKKTLPLP